MSIRLRVAGPDDEVSIGTLMGELMPHADVARRQEWLYSANPDGRAITVLATDEETGALAGMTSSFPRRMLVRGRIVQGALGGDGWVRPQFRRRGIGALMHVASRAAQTARGIEMMFGTPTPANESALRFAGGRDVTHVRRWVRPLLSERLGLSRFLKDLAHPWGGGLSRTRLTAATAGDSALDAAWAELAAEGRIATVRDSEFLQWRFQDAPSGQQSLWVVRDGAGRVLGSCALEVSTEERRVRIIDVVARRDRFPRVLHAIVTSLEGVDGVELRVDDTTARKLGLWRYGFLPRERAPLNVVMSGSAGWNDSSFANGADWFSTWADTDLDATWRAQTLRPPRTVTDHRDPNHGLEGELEQTMTKRPKHLAALASSLTLAIALLPACSNQTDFAGDGARNSTNAPILGTAEAFLVLAGQTVTNSGPTTVAGDLGVYPGTAITGFPPGLLIGGMFHAADAVALQAQTDTTKAYDDLAAEGCDFTYAVPTDLGGTTLVPGTYCFASSASLTGTLTLDAGGASDAVFIFKTESTLITASNATVLMTNGAAPCNVFWKVGSSATIGTGTTFVGTVIALTSIALQTDAVLYGRALARNGEVTMDSNVVTAPLCGQTEPTPTPTETPSGTPTPSPTPSPTPEPECVPPTVEKAFTSPTIVEGGVSTLVITLTNTCSTAATMTAKMNDYFPAGMSIAGATVNTCGGTTDTGTTDTKVALTGGTIPAMGSCTVTVNVTVPTAGEYCNKIYAGDLQTDLGSNADLAFAILTVVAPTP